MITLFKIFAQNKKTVFKHCGARGLSRSLGEISSSFYYFSVLLEPPWRYHLLLTLIVKFVGLFVIWQLKIKRNQIKFILTSVVFMVRAI